jgi:hypothetical protein
VTYTFKQHFHIHFYGTTTGAILRIADISSTVVALEFFLRRSPAQMDMRQKVAPMDSTGLQVCQRAAAPVIYWKPRPHGGPVKVDVQWRKRE